jgi:transposase
MESIFPRCAGLDVHKETVEAHLRRIEPDGPLRQETRTWGMSTREIVALADWMAAQGVAHVAIISTGVYRKPIYSILGSRFGVLLVNAQKKRVPGQMNDIQDCQWITQMLRRGLLKGSFIPPRRRRELRDPTRHRTQLVEEKTRTINRILKVLEDAHIKLAGRQATQRIPTWSRSTAVGPHDAAKGARWLP